MNRSSAVAVAAMVVALFAVVTALFAAFKPPLATPAARGAEARADAEAHTQQLLVHMVLFQRYAEKAHLAAEADNWPLATFYSEEIEENAERLVRAGIVEDSVDVSALAAEVAVPRAAALLRAARAESRPRFDTTFAAMLDACNQCHKRTGHRFVQVRVPAVGGSYPSQSFAPIPGLRPEAGDS